VIGDTSLHRKELPALTFTARMGCESRYSIGSTRLGSAAFGHGTRRAQTGRHSRR
jgi:hypothetical protein